MPVRRHEVRGRGLLRQWTLLLLLMVALLLLLDHEIVRMVVAL
jgi:hypothetical protein